MLVTKPFPNVIAIVHIRSKNVEALTKGLLAFKAFCFVLAWVGPGVIEEYLDFIFKFLFEKMLGILEVFWFSTHL